MRRTLLLIALLLFAYPALAQTKLSEYAGRYTDGTDYVAYFQETPFGLTLRPALWTATQLLKQESRDEFVVVDRRERGASFHRDAQGHITSVTIRGMEGEGLQLMRRDRPLLPIEFLLAGQAQIAAREYVSRDPNDPARIISTAQRVLDRFPSKVRALAGFLAIVERHFPRSAKLNALLGDVQMEAGNRRAALASFRRAYQLDPTDKQAIAGLARLGALPADVAAKDNPWKLSFPLEQVFQPPTVAEIKAVETDWRERNLSPKDVEEVTAGTIKFDDDEFRVRIVAHRVDGSKHYGAIILPINATPGCCPVIVEAKGVSWNYFHLNLSRLDSPSFMGSARTRFIYVAPSYRGEVLDFNGKEYKSEGDRTNAWDGATDDAIALLNVALTTTPEADPNRIAVFGRSRGGSVALLMGERDSRIRGVVEWSGPTDWFSLMGTEGWKQQELFAEGLRTRAKPDETGGQLVEHFLMKAVRGEEDLPAVRHRMIAGSPLYFPHRLPRLQMHYGVEDTSVPVKNGLELAKRMGFRVAKASHDRKIALAIEKSHALYMRRGNSEAFFYPGQGHDTDRLLAPILSRDFLIDALLNVGTNKEKIR